MKKINYALLSRSLIALLFVVAGLQKIMHFGETSSSISNLGVPFSPLVTLIVIAIEVPVAIAFAYGYKTREAGYALIAFTALTILLVHSDFRNSINVIEAFKNLAIIGGIIAAIGCFCGDCVVHAKKHVHHEG
jgi:putative oxidoreductase